MEDQSGNAAAALLATPIACPAASVFRRVCGGRIVVNFSDSPALLIFVLMLIYLLCPGLLLLSSFSLGFRLLLKLKAFSLLYIDYSLELRLRKCHYLVYSCHYL